MKFVLAPSGIGYTVLIRTDIHFYLADDIFAMKSHRVRSLARPTFAGSSMHIEVLGIFKYSLPPQLALAQLHISLWEL